VLEQTMDVISRWGHWSYLLLFLGATLESAAFLGLLVPGESLVLASGFLAARGVFAVDELIVVVALGAILGDSLGYELGRRLGRPWLLRAGRWVGLRAAHLDRSEAVFTRYGGPTVLFGRFIGVLRALAPFIAGAVRMPYRQFLLYNLLGGVLWAMGCVWLGYGLGASWQVAEWWLGRASLLVGGVLVLVGGIAWLWQRRVRWGRLPSTVGQPGKHGAGRRGNTA
jgi:membrane protein DedA with SNARE-associated domain